MGPTEQRPARLDLAWHSTDPNLVGVDEFAKWSVKAGVEPMMAVNLGTRGTQAALDLLEYCNIDGGMRMIDPDLELVACGSSAPTMATFGEWERVVLTETYDLVDLISAHQCCRNPGRRSRRGSGLRREPLGDGPPDTGRRRRGPRQCPCRGSGHLREQGPYWQATAEDSTSVLPAANVSVKADGGRLTAELPAVSWSMIRLALDS